MTDVDCCAMCSVIIPDDSEDCIEATYTNDAGEVKGTLYLCWECFMKGKDSER